MLGRNSSEKHTQEKHEAAHVDTASPAATDNFAALIEPTRHLDAKEEKRMYRKVDLYDLKA